MPQTPRRAPDRRSLQQLWAAWTQAGGGHALTGMMADHSIGAGLFHVADGALFLLALDDGRCGLVFYGRLEKDAGHQRHIANALIKALAATPDGRALRCLGDENPEVIAALAGGPHWEHELAIAQQPFATPIALSAKARHLAMPKTPTLDALAHTWMADMQAWQQDMGEEAFLLPGDRQDTQSWAAEDENLVARLAPLVLEAHNLHGTWTLQAIEGKITILDEDGRAPNDDGQAQTMLDALLGTDRFTGETWEYNDGPRGYASAYYPTPTVLFVLDVDARNAHRRMAAWSALDPFLREAGALDLLCPQQAA